MPNPADLEVGDRIRFVAQPDEWSAPGYVVQSESVELLRTLVARRHSSRIARIDERGTPWIEVRTRDEGGRTHWHAWSITERTGWMRVVPRGSRTT